jgi:hypothetical protein
MQSILNCLLFCGRTTLRSGGGSCMISLDHGPSGEASSECVEFSGDWEQAIASRLMPPPGPAWQPSWATPRYVSIGGCFTCVNIRDLLGLQCRAILDTVSVHTDDSCWGSCCRRDLANSAKAVHTAHRCLCVHDPTRFDCNKAICTSVVAWSSPCISRLRAVWKY